MQYCPGECILHMSFQSTSQQERLLSQCTIISHSKSWLLTMRGYYGLETVQCLALHLFAPRTPSTPSHRPHMQLLRSTEALWLTRCAPGADAVWYPAQRLGSSPSSSDS